MKNRKHNFLADIIIPHHDRDDLLQNCLQKIPKDSFNVIIESTGTFAENCNRGAKKAITKNLIFMNDDVEISEQALINLCKKKFDIVGVAQKVPNHADAIYGLGFSLLNEGKKTRRFFAKNQKDVLYPSGFLFKISKKSWKLLGGFNEDFKNGCEDSDLFLRAIENKITFGYINDIVLHLHSQSTGRNENDNRNMILLDSLWTGKRIEKLFYNNNFIIKNGDVSWVNKIDDFVVVENRCPYCGAEDVDDVHINKCFEKSPLISVIIPSREGEEIQSMETLKSQTYKNIEIKIEYDKNKEGASVMRNRGAKKAKGKFLFFCDNDLTLSPNCISDLYLTLTSSKNASWAFGKFYVDGNLYNENKDVIVPHNKYSMEWLEYFCFISTMSLIRSDANPVFDENIKRFNDWDLWLSLCRAEKKPVFCDRILFSTRTGKNGISNSGLKNAIKWKNYLFFKYEIDVDAINMANKKLKIKITNLKLEISLMKSSKFWKLRDKYIYFKNGMKFMLFSPSGFIKKYFKI